MPNRSLEPTLEHRHALSGVIRRTKPRWLFAPYWEDAHPDHTAATQLIEASRFWAKLTKTDLPGEPFHPERIFYYYCVHLRQALQPTFVLDISDYYARKRAALECYHSQFVVGRTGLVSFIDRLQTEDAHWGNLISTQYAEPFAMREPLGLRSFRDFV